MSPSRKERLGIGVVGGGFVAGFHIRSFEAVRNADIRGVVSRTTETATNAAALAKELRVGDAKVFDSITKFPSINNVVLRDIADTLNVYRLKIKMHAIGNGRKNSKLVRGIYPLHINTGICLGVTVGLGF